MLIGRPSSPCFPFKCKSCTTVLAAFEFGTRQFRGEQVRKVRCSRCLTTHSNCQKNRRTTEAGRESHRRALTKYQAKPAYKAAVALYEKSDKNKAKMKRANDKIMADPGKKLMKFALNKLSDALAGRRHSTSSTLLSYTEFTSADDAIVHFEPLLKPGWTMENYGTAWEVDHTIPRKWYDAADDDDLKRCWKKSNLAPMAPKANNAKRIAIPEDAVLYQVGTDCWPKAWKGVPPTAAERIAWYKEHHDMRMKRVKEAAGARLAKLGSATCGA